MIYSILSGAGEKLSGSISGRGQMLMRDRVKVGWRIKCDHFLVSYDTVAEKKTR